MDKDKDLPIPRASLSAYGTYPRNGFDEMDKTKMREWIENCVLPVLNDSPSILLPDSWAESTDETVYFPPQKMYNITKPYAIQPPSFNYLMSTFSAI